jgi:serine/threonine protein kinase
VVYRAKDKKTNQIVALKRLKMEREKEGFPITSLREINTLLISQHENVVTVREIVVGSNMDKIYIGKQYTVKFKSSRWSKKCRLIFCVRTTIFGSLFSL